MEQKSKPILGLNFNGKLYFSKEEKQIIINDYLSSNCSKRDIWKKYTGRDEEHGMLVKWMRQLGYKIEKEKVTFASKPVIMQKQENKEEKSFETLQLEKRVKELEKQLKDAEMKAIAFSTMVDIAEEEFKIEIRKKYNTKP